MSAMTPLAPGTLLEGRFEIESLLNTGGFALIYRAVDLEKDEYVVVKECAPQGLAYRDESGMVLPLTQAAAAMREHILTNFRTEAQVLAKLTAAGIENITDYVADFEANGTHYIVMGEAVGYDLHRWAESYRQQGKPFPAQALENILTDMLEVLTKVHACGFFHCDIKPANIVIDEEGELTLIDFGAVRTAEQQHDDTVQVSPGFSPPEFYPSHRAQIGPWTDMYMLAALFYDIIAGRAPEPANERAVVDRTPRLSANPALHKIYRDSFLISIDKALAVDYQQRFASAKQWEAAYLAMKSGRQLIRANAHPGRQRAHRKAGRLRANNSRGPLAMGVRPPGAAAKQSPLAAAVVRPTAARPAAGVRPAAPLAGGVRPIAPVPQVSAGGPPWGLILLFFALVAVAVMMLLK